MVRRLEQMRLPEPVLHLFIETFEPIMLGWGAEVARSDYLGICVRELLECSNRSRSSAKQKDQQQSLVRATGT